MKKLILAILTVVGIIPCMASCKTNTNAIPNTANFQNSYSDVQNYGEVTDKNGIIGDSDDFIKRNKTDNKSNNAVKNAGDIVNNAAHNAGDVVNNVADKAGNTVENIADNVGDTIKNATR